MRGRSLAGGSRIRDQGCEGQSRAIRSPGRQSAEALVYLQAPSQNPKKRQAGPRAESQIEPWFARARPQRLPTSRRIRSCNEETDADAADCPAIPGARTGLSCAADGTDGSGEEPLAISETDVCP